MSGVDTFDVILGRDFLRMAIVDHQASKVTWPITARAAVVDGSEASAKPMEAVAGGAREREASGPAVTGRRGRGQLPPSRGDFDHRIELKDPNCGGS